jgi:hypothetical protein
MYQGAAAGTAASADMNAYGTSKGALSLTLLLLLLPQKIAKAATKTEPAVNSSSLRYGHESMRFAHSTGSQIPCCWLQPTLLQAAAAAAAVVVGFRFWLAPTVLCLAPTVPLGCLLLSPQATSPLALRCFLGLLTGGVVNGIELPS